MIGQIPTRSEPRMADLGKKHECSACGAKYYDLGKPEPLCPKCGANLDGKTLEEVEAEAAAAKAAEEEAALAEAKQELAAADGTDDSEE
jgi:hypothetical protein